MISVWAGVLIATARATAVDRRVHAEGFYQTRETNARGFPPPRVLSEGFFLGDYAVSWANEMVFAEVKPQVRAVTSPGVGTIDPRAVTVATSPRWLNARRLIGRGPAAEAYVDLDRLNVRYRGAAGEAYVGRRPVSLGVLTMIPVWNKLTQPLGFRAGPEWIENPDGAGLSTAWGDVRARLLHVRGTDPAADLITVAELRYARGASEVHALGGSWWQYGAGGLAGSTDWKGATFKFEGLHFWRQDRALTQWGLAVERALGARWAFDLEYLHQSTCEGPAYGAAPPTRFQVLSGCDYLFPFATVRVNTAWRWGGGVLTNVRDPGAVIIFDADYAWTDEWSVELKLKRAIGRSGSEFGADRIRDPFGRTAGAPSTVYVTVSHTH